MIIRCLNAVPLRFQLCSSSLMYVCRSVSNDTALSDKDQSLPPTYETVPGTYEEIPATSRRGVKHYEYTQNQAYATTTMSESGRGN